MPYEGLDPFITEDELSDYLGRDVSDANLATIAVGAACAAVRNAAGQRFDLVDDEEILVDGSGTDTILLPELPVVDVTEVLDDTTELDPDDDYLVNRLHGTLVRRSCTSVWTAGRGNYSVTYSHGFAEIPDDLRLLALHLAARVYDQGLVKQESVGGYSATFASDDPIGLTPRELNIVAKYRPARAAASYDA